MKLVVAGKGGSGKTSIAGTLARLLGRAGRQVIAIDGDSNPNLALTLGIPEQRVDPGRALPADLAYRDADGIKLRLSLAQVCEAFAIAGPDNVRLLLTAHPQEAGTGCLSLRHCAARTVVGIALDGPGHAVVLDTEASSEHLTRATGRHADAMLIVAEPYPRSLVTARRMAPLARQLGIPRVFVVANKLRDDAEEARVRAFAGEHDLEVIAAIPHDPSLAVAERAGIAPLDHDPGSPLPVAVGRLIEALQPAAQAD
jgi:CO dehydrogenase maturation factor